MNAGVHVARTPGSWPAPVRPAQHRHVATSAAQAPGHGLGEQLVDLVERRLGVLGHSHAVLDPRSPERRDDVRLLAERDVVGSEGTNLLDAEQDTLGLRTPISQLKVMVQVTVRHFDAKERNGSVLGQLRAVQDQSLAGNGIGRGHDRLGRVVRVLVLDRVRLALVQHDLQDGPVPVEQGLVVPVHDHWDRRAAITGRAAPLVAHGT